MRWEYQTLAVEHGWFSGGHIDAEDVNDQLNGLGQEGWDLVSAFDTNGNGTTRFSVFVFKRPLPKA
jgi:hypothetical protein